jgi:hypothetical protein
MKLALILASLVLLIAPRMTNADPIKTEVVQNDGKWQLLRDGKPYLIKGAGGGRSMNLLAEMGGNSVRTWGADNLQSQLDEAQKLGLTVTVGIWLEHERKGFDYNDEKQVAAQLERAKQAILKYKDHPAVLIWGIGNEMEGYKPEVNPAIWKAVNDIAAMAKQIDPNHPTMTVIAEIGGKKIPSIHQMCPAIDVVGINSYGGCPTIAKRYKDAGGTKPYVITEFGPVGWWEIPKTPFGAVQEPTSTDKAAMYRKSYEGAVSSQPGLCLGSYAFLWGWKQEATLTWFGMLMPDGNTTEAAVTMSELWTGKPAKNHAPVTEHLKLAEGNTVAPGTTINASLKASDPDGDPITTQWVLTSESKYGEGGDKEAPLKTFSDAIVSGDNTSARVKIPAEPGIYRLYAYVKDDHNHCSVSNVPILAKAEAASETDAAPKLVIYADDMKDAPFTPSGWMGKTDAIALDPACTTSPHKGKTCMKLEYRAADIFGGVVWQYPANDWGDKPDARDLSGAKRLSFWARGEKGGEKVEFKFGILDPGKKFADSASGSTTEELTTEWKNYSIDLAGKDMSKIKTGFCWVVAGQRAPITFYLDDVRYE